MTVGVIISLSRSRRVDELLKATHATLTRLSTVPYILYFLQVRARAAVLSNHHVIVTRHLFIIPILFVMTARSRLERGSVSYTIRRRPLNRKSRTVRRPNFTYVAESQNRVRPCMHSRRECVLDMRTQNEDEPVGEITYPGAKLPF